jgi:hypothetical protein
VLAVTGGTAWFAAGFLWSSLFWNEHTSAAACVATPFLNMALVSLPGLGVFPALDLFNIMSGDQLPYLDQETRLLIGPLPRATLLAVLAVATTLLAAASWMTENRDF